MRREGLVLDGPMGPDARGMRVRRRLPAGDPIRQLPAALHVLSLRMRAAVVERRTSPPGSELYRRADEEIAYLNELAVRLQRRMEIPDEIWLLDRERTRAEERAAAAKHR